MRRKRFFSSMAFVLSLVMLAVSGAMFVHSAQQQSASTSLSVTFSGHNVNCSVEGWYQVKGDTQRTALVDNDNDVDNVVTFSATEGSTEKTLEINNVASENKAILTSQKEYVLFTYKFTNTATDGAYGIEVSLTLDSISNSNLKAVKYGTSSSLYTNSSAGLGDQYTTLSSSSDTVFTDVFIVAGGDDTLATGTGIKYFYILLEVNDLTLPVSFTPDFTWTIESSNNKTDTSNVNYTLSWTTNGTIEDGSLYIWLSTGGHGPGGEGVFLEFEGSEMTSTSGSETFKAGTIVYIHVQHATGHAERLTWALTTPTSTMYQANFSNYVVLARDDIDFGTKYDVYDSFTMNNNYTLTFTYNG